MTDEDLVAAFVRERGVTLCPVAFAAPCSAAVRPEDAAAHLPRGLDPAGDSYRSRHQRGWAAYWAARRRRRSAGLA